ncbi:MAG TPA: rhodanese-like domain-containing protein [Rhizomicrobium sp.]|jgi:rhodanese-related sulfurtransferase|nr:rhodanese-like domain-containing protein [Rhizomicrobium sp.]
MPNTVKELLATADAQIPRITPAEAQEMVAKDGAVIVDVRDSAELQASGKAKGAIHIPRGSLEFKADDTTSYHDKNLARDRPVILYCAAGSRAALAGKALKDMGYQKVFNLGGFKDWVDAGCPVDPA